MIQPVMWRSIHDREMRRWKTLLVYAIVVIVIVCGLFYLEWTKCESTGREVSSLSLELNNYRARDQILTTLRVRGMSLSQGLDITDALIFQSKKHDIPLSLSLAIMAKESEFQSQAISVAGAKGLMQLLPSTFNSYNRNLNLGLNKSAIFDPIVNIRIAILHLRDLITELKSKTQSESELWNRVLTAYSGGARNYPQDVKRIQKNFEQRFRDGDI